MGGYKFAWVSGVNESGNRVSSGGELERTPGFPHKEWASKTMTQYAVLPEEGSGSVGPK